MIPTSDSPCRACGTPVITSHSSSLPEVVGEAGLTVSSEDSKALAHAMRRVLDDPALREDLAQKGVQQAKKFTWQAAAQKLLTIYEGLVYPSDG